MGVELVEGKDQWDNHKVDHKTTAGLQQVDIYRRWMMILDRWCLTAAVLGALPASWVLRKGNVAIVNAVGNGVADDKAIYSYVPTMIRYYLNEEPLLKMYQPTSWQKTTKRKHVFKNIERMVIKTNAESSGYGMLMGSAATERRWKNTKTGAQIHGSLLRNPSSACRAIPCYMNGIKTQRDLRPMFYGPDGIEIVPGGLTRVALEGSTVGKLVAGWRQ